MTAGEKIKKYRTEKGLSQKELALRTGMSEPAIRNYELGNRQPSEKQLEKIAYSLEVSIFALSSPNLDVYDGVMHSLFYLEDKYALIPYKEDSKTKLYIDNKNIMGSSLYDMVSIWAERRRQLEKGEITKEYYDEWRSSYPESFAKEIKNSLKENSKKKAED